MSAIPEAVIVLGALSLIGATFVPDEHARMVALGFGFMLYAYWRVTGLPDARPWW